MRSPRVDDWLGGHSWWSEKPQHRFFGNVTLGRWTIVANVVEPRSRKKGTSKLRIESAFWHPLHAFSCYLQNAYRNSDTKLSIAATQIFISNLSVRHQEEFLQATVQAGFRSRMVAGWGRMLIGGFFSFVLSCFLIPLHAYTFEKPGLWGKKSFSALRELLCDRTISWHADLLLPIIHLLMPCFIQQCSSC